jgi:hypothetical protein
MCAIFCPFYIIVFGKGCVKLQYYLRCWSYKMTEVKLAFVVQSHFEAVGLCERHPHSLLWVTHRIKFNGLNVGLPCSWPSVVTHDVTSRHA